MEVEINHKTKTGKQAKTWRLNDVLLNSEWDKMRSRKKSKDILKQMKMRKQ